jgi:hypothetical protein
MSGRSGRSGEVHDEGPGWSCRTGFTDLEWGSMTWCIEGGVRVQRHKGWHDLVGAVHPVDPVDPVECAVQSPGWRCRTGFTDLEVGGMTWCYPTVREGGGV